MLPRSLAALGVVVAAAVAAPSALAGSVQTFYSPTGNIACEIGVNRPGIGSYAYCQTFRPARSVRLSRGGALHVCSGGGCIGDPAEDAWTLGYGESETLGPFRCTSLTSGMRCVVRRTGHGFLIRKAGVRRV